MSAARDAVGAMLRASVLRLSPTEAALYGTPEARSPDRRATFAEADAIRHLSAMIRDYERAYDAATAGIVACNAAIVAINESRRVRGLPELPR